MSRTTESWADMGDRLTLDDVPTVSSRAVGAMLAAAAGDALGWPVEPRGNRVGGTVDLRPQLDFIEWRRREGGRYAPHERIIPAGAYSDDTQLMLAVARSLTLGPEWWEHLTRVELPLWTLYELGGGGAVRRAANSWARGVPPWTAENRDRQKYFDAGANGVAMRILPHSIYGASKPFEQVAEHVMADGITTHGHPRALVGALALAYAQWKAVRWEGKLGYGELAQETLRGLDAWAKMPAVRGARGWADSADDCYRATYGRAWERTVDEMEGLLLSVRDAIGRGSMSRDTRVLEELGAYSPEGGAGTRTVAAGLYLAGRYAVQPSSGLLAAAFARKTDTDTIACITGSLLGAVSGPDWLRPIVRSLQDRDYITSLAEQVAQHTPAKIHDSKLSPTWKRYIPKQLSLMSRGDALALPLFGRCQVTQIERPDTRSQSDIGIWWLTSDIGQTFAVTRVSRRSAQTSIEPTSGTIEVRDHRDERPVDSSPRHRDESPRAPSVRAEISDPASSETRSRNSRAIDELRREIHRLELEEKRRLRAGDASPAELERWNAEQKRAAAEEEARVTESVHSVILYVQDRDRTASLYRTVLRLPTGRRTDTFTVIGRNLVLRRESNPSKFVPQRRWTGWRDFDSASVLSVGMHERFFKVAHEWLSRQRFAVTQIVRDGATLRFRFVDYDDHVIEVFTRA